MKKSELNNAQNVVSGVISTIFLNEDYFKKTILSEHLDELNVDGCWSSDFYSIDECHAARSYRFLLKNYEGKELELYIDSNHIFDFIVENNKNLTEIEK
jgi:hypothetical protein